MNELLMARATVAGGVFTTKDALACGYDRQALSRLASGGTVVRIGQGAYAPRESYLKASPEQRHCLATRAVVQRLAGRAAASHFSALSLLGLPVWKAPLGRVHVTRTGDGCARRSVNVHIHKDRDPDAYTLIDGTACVRPALAVLGTAMQCGVESGVVAADAALARDLVTEVELRCWLDRLLGYPSMRSARLTVDLADGRSESVGESRTRLMLRSFDLGVPTPQVGIRDDNGFLVGRVDFLYEQQRTIIEIEWQATRMSHRARGCPRARWDKLASK